MSKKNPPKKIIKVNIPETEGVPQLPENIVRDIKEAVLFTFEKEAPGRSFNISVILTCDGKMAELNRRYLNKNYPTDILTFPYSTGRNINADIFISLDRALSQSKEYNHSFKQEILFLVLHGVLHLTGWDDSDERLRQKMLSRQEELLRKINVFLARYLLILLLNCIFQF